MANRVAVVISSNGPSNGVVVPLQYAENDGRRMATALADPACGFNVITPSSNDPEVVRSLIYRTAEGCAPEDNFLVYFSGHGAVGAHGLCLMLDKTDMRQPLSTGLAGEDLMRAMRASRAGSRILILDCCNARQIVRQAGWKAAEDRVPMADLGFVSDSYDIILASEAFGDGAREFVELESGFLTAKLIEALGAKRQAADTDGDGAISVTDALLWLQHQAREHNRRNPEQSVPIPSRAGVGQSVGYLTRPPRSWPKITVPLPDGSPAIILPLAPLEGRWAFAMGQRPVTNGQYSKSGLRPPEGKCFFEKNWKGDPPFKPWDDPMFEGDSLPIVCVDRRAAKLFCDYLIGCNEKSNSWIYIDLPCPELWDLAAFGDTYPKRISDAWVGVQDAVHSGQAPKACLGAMDRTNRFGFEDLIGNVWEWCGAV